MIFKNYVMGLIYDDIGRVLLIKKKQPKHAQWEIRQTAIAMKELINGRK